MPAYTAGNLQSFCPISQPTAFGPETRDRTQEGMRCWQGSRRSGKTRRGRSIGTSVETAEQRLLPAGNVLATLKGGSLKLTGDNDSNRVRISVTGEGIVVEGQTNTSGDREPTTINGEPSVIFPDLDSITGNLTVNMKGGDDEVFVGTDVAGNVKANMGKGRDALSVSTPEIGGNVSVNLGAGADFLPFSTSVGGDVRIKTGAADTFLDDVRIRNSMIEGNLNVKGGKNKQLVLLEDTTVEKKVSVSLGSGDDSLAFRGLIDFGSFSANGGSGIDGFDEEPGHDLTNLARGFERFS